jgi:hypothetical protein
MRRIGAVIATVACLTAWSVSAAAGAGASAPKLGFETGVSTSYVWLASASGSGARRLGQGQEPLVSPSGGLVAAALDDSTGPALVIYGDAGGPHRFLNVAKAFTVPLAWSPDSRYLLVQLSATNVSGKGSGLALLDTQNWTVRTVATGQIWGASFNPSGSGEFIYGRSSSQLGTAAANLYEAPASGGAARLLTHDGNSLNPVWTAKGIVYDHETRRGINFPEYQLWLRTGSHARQLTHVAVNPLVAGLVPVAADRSGNRLIASFEGQDTGYAVAVQISPLKVRDIAVGKQYVTAGGISADGKTLLLNVGSFEQTPSHGTIDSQPFGGGHATVLTKGAEGASWNR